MKDNLQLATDFLYHPIKGRYVTMHQVDTFLSSLNTSFKVLEVGKSVENNSIKCIEFGTGIKKILIWSQMHGNESTTTKGLIDFINYLNKDKYAFLEIKEKFTFKIIPILNPDGAILYTRENANKIDLNRDAFDCTQPESLVLRKILSEFNPDFCFNLHDQRTIFGLLESKKPATMSFLTASYNEELTFNETRNKAANVIVAVKNELEKYIPGQIGRFDDSFNINCTGDYFTKLGYPTILFEAGHFENDYNRDIVRNYVFVSINAALFEIYENVIVDNNNTEYLKINQNNKCFVDIIYKNVQIIKNNENKIINFAVHFKEVLKNDEIFFEAFVFDTQIENNILAHKYYDAQGRLFQNEIRNFPIEGDFANFNLFDIKVINGEAHKIIKNIK